MIEVRTSPIHGRGVFATRSIEQGEGFHAAELLIFPAAQYQALQQTAAAHYVFHVADNPDGSADTINGLAMSRISFINHAKAPNCTFKVDADAQTIAFSALRDVQAGEELTIDYGDFAEKCGITD